MATILPSPKEALNEYFKMKMKYESQINANKKKIMNNPTLSKREKRSEFLKLKPKCINCKRPGGTKFQVVYFDEKSSDDFDSYREYRAECGIVVDPCPLEVKIKIGKVDLLPDILSSMEKEIKTYKDKIINDKLTKLDIAPNTNLTNQEQNQLGPLAVAASKIVSNPQTAGQFKSLVAKADTADKAKDAQVKQKEQQLGTNKPATPGATPQQNKPGATAQNTQQPTGTAK